MTQSSQLVQAMASFGGSAFGPTEKTYFCDEYHSVNAIAELILLPVESVPHTRSSGSRFLPNSAPLNAGLFLCRFHYVTLNVGLHPLARSSRPSFKGDALAASCPCGLRSPHPNHAAVCCRMRFGHSSLSATAARGSTLIERQPAVRLPVDAYPFQAADPRSYHSRCRARLAVDRSGFAGGQKRACFLAASVGVFTLRPDPVQPHVWVYLPPGLGLCLPTSAGRLSCSPLAFAKGVPPTSWRTTRL